MLVEIGAPAVLPLGLLRLQGGAATKVCWLGITLQHPPVLLAAQSSPQLQITGARADVAYSFAQRFLHTQQITSGAEVEIELAIPAQVGLGSETMVGLSVAHALVWLHNQPTEDIASLANAIGLETADALEIWGFDRGGLLLTTVHDPLEPPLRRLEIAHKANDAWAFVLHFPKIPDGVSETVERERRQALIQAAPHIDPAQSQQLLDALWRAVQQDDLATFGQALLQLQQMNADALTKAGAGQVERQDETAVLSVMQAQGAVAWGNVSTGYARFALVRGAAATIALRKALQQHLGHFGGTVMAAITDNRGAQQRIQNLTLAQYTPPNWSNG